MAQQRKSDAQSKKALYQYEHTFYVLIEAASDCLLGLDFLSKQIFVMHYFQKANWKLIETQWSLFTENSFRSTKSKFIE